MPRSRSASGSRRGGYSAEATHCSAPATIRRAISAGCARSAVRSKTRSPETSRPISRATRAAVRPSASRAAPMFVRDLRQRLDRQPQRRQVRKAPAHRDPVEARILVRRIVDPAQPGAAQRLLQRLPPHAQQRPVEAHARAGPPAAPSPQARRRRSPAPAASPPSRPGRPSCGRARSRRAPPPGPIRPAAHSGSAAPRPAGCRARPSRSSRARRCRDPQPRADIRHMQRLAGRGRAQPVIHRRHRQVAAAPVRQRRQKPQTVGAAGHRDAQPRGRPAGVEGGDGIGGRQRPGHAVTRRTCCPARSAPGSRPGRRETAW